MKNKIKILALYLMLGYGLVYAQGNNSVEKSPVLTVKAKSPELKSIQGSIPVSGNIVAWQEAVISGEVSGVKIEEIFVDVGSFVRKGQILAKLNDKSIMVDLEQANAALEEAKANLFLAEQNAERVRKLEGTDALSEMQRNQYLAAEKMARAKVSSANAMVNNLKIRLDQTNVVAPEDGTISERKATVGTIIGTGEMFKMIVKDKLQWQANISSDKLIFIEKGQKIFLQLASGEKINAEINEVAPKVNFQTRQGVLLVNLTKDKHKGKISPGMFVSGEIVSAKQEQMVVGKNSVVLRDGANYVFTLDGTKVNQKKVTLGKKMGDEVIIKDGLTLKDNVVIQGAGFLKNGDTVRVVKD